MSSRQDDFSQKIKTRLAQRSGYECAICQALTIGPSAETPESVSNGGTAAHIAAASPDGRRYDALMSSTERSSITNGIWLCASHGRLIDTDSSTWTVSVLHQVKKQHERNVATRLCIPQGLVENLSALTGYKQLPSIKPQLYGFMSVGAMDESYKSFLTPMLKDKGIGEASTLGVLMCGPLPEEADQPNRETPWTVLVNADWLRWYLDSREAGYKAAPEVPGEQIYGRIPAWPDGFFEFLEAIVQTNTTFIWQRHPDGYLVLEQQR